MIQSYFNVAVNSQVFQLLNYYSWIIKWSYLNVAVNSQVFLLSNQKSNLRNWMEHADCNLLFIHEITFRGNCIENNPSFLAAVKLPDNPITFVDTDKQTNKQTN